jgi:PhnB protein
MAVRPIPEGYHSVTPGLTVPGVAKLIDFLKQAFGAEVTEEPVMRPDGGVMHAEVKIGDSRIMLGEPMGDFGPMPGNFYLYVEDADSVYRKALQAGATSIAELTDQFWGDRAGGVRDQSGNIWWIAMHKEELSRHEMMKRVEAFMGQQR